MISPLVPKDADLRSYTWLKLDYARLFASEFFAMANDAEFRAAFILWCKSMQQIPAGSLPNNDKCLAGWCGKKQNQWAKIKQMALHGWQEADDGRLYHPVLAEVVNDIFSKGDSKPSKLHLKEEKQIQLLEKHIQWYFFDNLNRYIPMAVVTQPRKFISGHIPDGFIGLPNFQNPIPVEVKRNKFNEKAEHQLRRYMQHYKSPIGVAVAPKFNNPSAQDIIYVQVEKSEVVQ